MKTENEKVKEQKEKTKEENGKRKGALKNGENG